MIRVLIVDDSSTMRRLLSAALQGSRGIEVIGTAADPYSARDEIVRLHPDVVTLDIEMPRMDGLTFLGRLMRYYPLPVIIVSSLTPAGSQTAIRALEIGAIDVVCKPTSAREVPEMTRRLADKILTAARARVRRPSSSGDPSAGAGTATPTGLLQADHALVAIGASTGGTEAIAVVLRALPAYTPATVIVQHMPQYFTAAFANRMNDLSDMEVREARDGDLLRPGLALVAPGDRHLLVAPLGKQYLVQVRSGPAVFHQRPSVEVLFNSVAQHAGSRAVGVLLTGMGTDGAQGLLTMRKAGAYTIAQDEASSVVYGMPRAAAELNAAETILPLEHIPGAILRALRRPRTKPETNPAVGADGG